jgi:hypothetical protein
MLKIGEKYMLMENMKMHYNVNQNPLIKENLDMNLH